MTTPTHTEETDLAPWLESLGLGEYAEAFRANHLTFDTLRELTDADLKECGVTSLGHRKLLLGAIQKLSSETPSPIPAAKRTGPPSRLGHFELLEPLGRGGIGAVYRAWDSSLNRQVALKILNRNLAANDPQFLQYFIREAQSAAGLKHPNIVQVYFAGEDAGEYYIAMELLEGQSLANRLERGPMEEKMVLRIARQIIEALAATSSRRLIHGDLKPHNIFLTASGDAKLLDFGLARKTHETGATDGTIVGSAYYLSPERAQGLTEDFRSDIYSLGATLFQALSGLPPFEADDEVSLVRKRLEEDAPRLRSVKPDTSAAMDQFIAGMLARDPSGRPPSYQALLAELTAIERASYAEVGLETEPRAAIPPASPAARKAPSALSSPSISKALPASASEATFPAAASAPTAVGSSGGARLPLWRRLTSRRFLFISVVAHLLFGLIAAVFVVQTISAKRKLTFTSAPPNPNPSQRALEHKVQIAKKQNTMSAPAQPKRIASTALAKVSLPDMPSLPSSTTHFMPGKMSGMGGTGTGLALASGTAGTGGAAGGVVPFFGLRGSGIGLAGKFYDLKQTRDGRPTGMAISDEKWGSPKEVPANKQYGTEITSFFKNGMPETSLDRFYRGPTPLYATQIFIPTIGADEAPKAFQVEDKVKPRRWLAVYRGKVIPPESGSFRFVGSGDDVLVVRFDNRIVLDAGYNGVNALPSVSDFQRKGFYAIDQMGGATSKAWHGDTFEVRANVVYPVEIAIGEWPGGEGAFCLLLEKVGAEYRKDSKGNPILPIFKLRSSEVKPGGKFMPVFAPDTSWSVWKSQPNTQFSGF